MGQRGRRRPFSRADAKRLSFIGENETRHVERVDVLVERSPFTFDVGVTTFVSLTRGGSSNDGGGRRCTE